jgi:hypothetical protein
MMVASLEFSPFLRLTLSRYLPELQDTDVMVTENPPKGDQRYGLHQQFPDPTDQIATKKTAVE